MAERHARARAIAELADELEASGQELDRRMKGRPDTPGNREAGAHWVGIERWGQRRLRVALGEPFVEDTYHPYRPDLDEDFEALRGAFAETRAETVALARCLAENGVDPEMIVRHNDLGDLSVGGWLAYLIQHPDQESRGRLRG